MLIKETHADVPVTVDGRESSMSMSRFPRCVRPGAKFAEGHTPLRRFFTLTRAGIFLFHPTLPQYPNA